jgi:enoyl reductase-like protein
MRSSTYVFRWSLVYIEIYGCVNTDFAKSCFVEKDGSVPCDLGNLTHKEVMIMTVQLMFVAHESRSIKLRNFTGDWLHRCERFTGVNGRKGPKASILQSFVELYHPKPFFIQFFKAYPELRCFVGN